MGDEGNVLDATRQIGIRKLLEQPAGRTTAEAVLRPAADAQAARPEAPKPEAHAGPESFDPDSSDYKACGWAGNKGLPALRVILKDGSEHACYYADLDTAHPGGSVFTPSAPGSKGNVITLRFAGRAKPFLVILEGLRLRRVWELIVGHQTPWIHELPTDVSFSPAHEPVIHSIRFKPIAAEAVEGAARG